MERRRTGHPDADIDDGRLTRTQLIDQLREARVQLDGAKTRLRGTLDMQAVVHELEVHQEEVRMQNEQLRETQRALEESCELYTDLYDFAPLAYITLDGNGVIADINLTGASLLGVERSRLIGTPLLLFVADEDRHILLHHLRYCRHSAPDAQLTAELRLRLRKTDAPKVIPVHLASRRAVKGLTLTFRMAITDLSGQYQAEAERRDLQLRQQAAQAANEAKDRFLAILSHELRTPLTPVLAAATAIQLNGGMSDEVRNLIDITRRNIEIEARLIDDLLDVTRISRGKLHLAAITVDVNSVVNDVKLLFAEECAAKDLRCDSQLKAESHYVCGDPVRLRQVVWNLVKNAIKFTPRGGTVTLRTVNDASGRVVLSVSDTGIGIEPQEMDNLFAAFEQASKAVRPMASGLGLGLYICKAMIDAHNGIIRASSSGRNKGSTFDVYLDTVPAPADGPTQAPVNGDQSVVESDSKLNQAGVDILLVEDHADTASIMVLLLKRHGYRVKLANTIKDALTLVNDGVDLVISDLGLPDGSGMDLIRQIHKDSPIPAIALSGYGTDEDIRRSREAGFSEHLVKPVNFPKLLVVVRHLAAVAS